MAPASRVVDIKVKELNQVVTPFVLKSTPAVLSIGKRCADQSFFFLWPAGGSPFFVRPDGKVIGLDVIGHIPYVRSGSDCCRARPAKEVDTKSIESLLVRLGATTSAASLVINDISTCAADELENGREPALEQAPQVEEAEVAPPPPPPPVAPEPAERRDRSMAEHQLTHKPKRDDCDSCLRGKMVQARKFKGAFNQRREATRWCDILTMDHYDVNALAQ